MLQIQHSLIKTLSGLALVCIFTLLIAVIFAWVNPFFSASVNDFLKLMSLGTAFCLFLLSAALLIKLCWSHPVADYLCLIVFILALFRFCELMIGMHYLDLVFVALTGFSLDDINGAMSSVTSICLLFMATSIFFSADVKNNTGKWEHWVSLILTFYVMFLLTIALSGYFLNLIPAFTWMGMRMSPHTAITLMVLALVIYIINAKPGLEVIYKTSVKQRFSFGVVVVFFFGAIIFIILQQQINYVNSINNSTMSKLSNLDQVDLTELKKIIAMEYQVKELILILITGFALACVVLFSGIFFSLTFQLKNLNKLLLGYTGSTNSTLIKIPYLKDNTEFGLIARSIESFISLNQSQNRLQARLQKIIESMPNGIIMINQQGIIDLVNDQICKIFQYDRHELMGKSIEILMSSSTANYHPNLRDAYFSMPEARTMGAGRELFGLTKSGKEIALEIGLAPIESDHGMQVLASIVDITEKKVVEKNLALSREKEAVTSRALGIGIWEFDPSNNQLIWDETMLSLYEVDPKDFKGIYTDWRDRVHPDDIVEHENSLMFAINNNQDFIAKFRIIVPGGRIKYIQAKATADHCDGSVARIIGTNFDVTREELALLKIQQLDTLRASIVEYSEDAIISKTIEGVVTSWNRAAEKMFGYPESEVIGRNIKEIIIPPERAVEHDELLQQVSNGNIVRNYQSQSLCKNGELLDVSISLSPIKDANGKIISISSIKRDISELIKSENALLEYQQELERSNKSLETFAYVASHDLKAPLRGISQLATWLEEDIRENNLNNISETTDKIKIRIKRMDSLLDDLLTYSRVEKMQGFYKEINVNQSVVGLFNMNNTKPEIKLVIANNLPVFSTYVTPLEQVFSNLMSNAIKHHDKTSGSVTISSRAVNNDWYEFSVMDDGPGIDSQFHQRIFTMFQTLKPRDEVEGSGMGLALVKKIVEQYGGTVKVESNGRGCRFKFTWPTSIAKAENND
jgi:PAS domain S-box-containing protein